MTQGLLQFDAAERMVVCNRRYIEMYGLSPEVVKPGCSFRDLIAHRKETGSFAGDVEEYCSSILRNNALGKASRLNVVSATGRPTEILNKPLQTAGWAADASDSTR